MIDLRLLRQDPERFRASQQARGEPAQLVDEVLAADEARRSAGVRFDELRAEQKAYGKRVAAASGDEKAALVAAVQDLAAAVKTADGAREEADARAAELLAALPNLVEDGVPPGGAEEFKVLEHVGDQPDFTSAGFTAKDHLEIGEGLGAIDTARGAKVSGSRFYFLTGVGAQLELALLNLAMAQAIEAGFVAMITPTLVRPEIMAGTGFLGAHADEIYRLEADDLYLTGTSEVALAGFHAEEILDLRAGPKRYAGWSSCYRREAGSYGKDTRGIIRVHQFNKVEMFSFCPVEEAGAEHQRLLGWEREMLAKVELPYRIIDVAAGDLGSSAARKYDCEAWLPSQRRWMEVTSTSNCTTFQARRLGVRTRTEDGSTSPVATLNGTLATTRWIVALLENHQRADGSVHVPAALRPYLGGVERLVPPS